MDRMRRNTLALIGGLATGALAGCDRKPDATPNPAAGSGFRFQASWSNDAEFLGYYVALDPKYDYYRKGGLSVDYLSGGPQVIPESSLLNRKADVTLATCETAAQYIVRDKVPFAIVGAQYQKNPIGIVSLAGNPIRKPADLVGKRVAVAPVNKLTMDAMLKINDIDASKVELIPYTYDPKVLLDKTADATVDFITNVPYVIQQRGGDPVSLSMDAFGFHVFNDIVVVYQETMEKRLDAISAFLAGSMVGWEENFRNDDFARFPKLFADTRFKDNGRVVENEVEFNKRQKPLMDHKDGYFSMDHDAIRACRESLKALGYEVDPIVFDSRALDKARELAAKLRTSG